MSQFGITPTGFREKTLPEIRQSLYDRLIQVKDPDSGETLQVNFDENDPIINIINSFIDSLSQSWKILSQTYDQFNPNRAAGASLSGLVQLNGITRKTGSPSSVVVTFTGEPGRKVPANTIVSSDINSIKWKTDFEVTIGADSVVSVTAHSTTNGHFTISPGTINVIDEPLLGIQSVINSSSSVPGSVDESDEELRIRRQRSTEIPSRGIAESIAGGLLSLDGVSYVKIFCNRTNQPDERGIPGKSMAVVVQGGDDVQVAEQIFIRSGATTEYYGTTSVEFMDSLQQSTTVSFTRPRPVPIRVDITVDDMENVSMSSEYKQQIIDNIIAFAESGPAGIDISLEIFDDYGFPPSENVVVSRLYIPINAVKGCKIVDLKIAREEEELSADDVNIDWNEVAQFSADNIVIKKVSQ